MAQCEIPNALAKGVCIDMSMSECTQKISQRPQSEIKFYSNSYLPDDYFSYEKAVSYFQQGITNKPPSGLINIGYNCYMNSVIQCLAYTPGFQQFCLSMPNVMYEKNSDSAFFLDSFAHMFSLLSEKKSICPDWLLSDCHLISEMYKLPVQQDAHEFLLNILDKFDNECRAALGNTHSLSNSSSLSFSSNSSSSVSLPSSPSDSIPDSSNQQSLVISSTPTFNGNTQHSTSKIDTMISNFFCGYSSISISCNECGLTTYKSSKFTDINIPILEYPDAETAVNDILSFQSQEIEGKCENCGKEACLTMSKQVNQFPLVLILTLMRFNNSLKKLEDFFEFQKILTIHTESSTSSDSESISDETDDENNSNNIKYQLYAMVVHEGRLINHGHFNAYVMDASGDWYKTDDVCIFKVKEEKILSSSPYVLFYKRIDL